jgi:hypothetical protein
MALITVTPTQTDIIVKVGEDTAGALAARTAAEASAAVALAASGPNYADTAAGLAATVVGETFAVDEGATVAVYSHDAGQVATFLRRFIKQPELASGSSLVGFQQSGSGAVTRTLQDKGREIVSVADYGADLTGATDGTAAVQAAIDANPGKTIVFPNGVVKIDSRVIVTSDDTVLDLGNCEIDARTFTGWATGVNSGWDTGRFRSVFEFRGTLKSPTTLNGDVSVNSATITVADATGIAIGDLIRIASDGQLWYTENSTAWYVEETNEVVGISGNTLTLAYRTKFAYDATAHTVNVEVYTPIKNCQLVGGRSFGGGVRGNILNGFGPSFALFEGFKDCACRPDYVEGFQNGVMRFNYGIGAVFDGGTIRGHAADYTTAIVEDQNSGFYGPWFARGRDGYFRCKNAYRLRHVQDGSQFDGCRIEMMNPPQGGHNTPYGAHGGTDNFVFDRCHYTGNFSAVLWRGFSVEVTGCRWRCLASQRSGFGDAAGSYSDMPRRYVFRDNDISASRHAILMLCHRIGTLQITGSQRLENALEAGFPSVLVTRARVAQSFVGSGTDIITVSAEALRYSADALVDGDIVNLDGVTLRGYTATGARLFTSQTGVIFYVGSNIAIPNGGSNIYFYGSGAILRIGATGDGTGATDFNSGSNSNGNWTRWPDGTMICSRIISAAPTTTTAYTWPQTFTAAPTVSFAFNRSQDGDYADIALRANSTTGYSVQSSAFPAGHAVHVIAYGRWR